MLSNIIANMHPDSSSIECNMLERVPGVQPQFRNRSGLGLSEQDREMNPYIIAEVKNPNGFSSLQQNSIVLVPLNHCRFLPEEGKVSTRRLFVKEKYIQGIAHNRGQWDTRGHYGE